jgi:hypothetical protein
MYNSRNNNNSIPTSPDYKQTGNKIPLSVDELASHVKQQLYQYDRLKDITQSEPGFNPYKNPVIYTTEEGKTVQIPAELQGQAIQQWKSKGQGQGQGQEPGPGQGQGHGYGQVQGQGQGLGPGPGPGPGLGLGPGQGQGQGQGLGPGQGLGLGQGHGLGQDIGQNNGTGLPGLPGLQGLPGLPGFDGDMMKQSNPDYTKYGLTGQDNASTRNAQNNGVKGCAGGDCNGGKCNSSMPSDMACANGACGSNGHGFISGLNSLNNPDDLRKYDATIPGQSYAPPYAQHQSQEHANLNSENIENPIQELHNDYSDEEYNGSEEAYSESEDFYDMVPNEEVVIVKENNSQGTYYVVGIVIFLCVLYFMYGDKIKT